VNSRADYTVAREDNRVLGLTERGDLAGYPVVCFHGTPGSRLSRHVDPTAYARVGARAISYDRPGYGLSTRCSRGQVVHSAADVAAVADALALEKFAVVGVSGGAPHALACAALLGDRIAAAAAIVPVGPADAMGKRFFQGMCEANVAEYRAMSEECAERESHFQGMMKEFVEDPGSFLRGMDLPAEDRLESERPDFRARMVEELTEAFRQGPGGWIDDDLALSAPWGFELDTIRVPVMIWWGRKDVLSPPSHAAYIAESISSAVKHEMPGGHLWSISKLPLILSELLLVSRR